MRFAIALLALLLVRIEARAADLTTIRDLYASASYEDALTALAAIPAQERDEHVYEYQALCFLALDRTADAETAVQELVRQHPLYHVEPREVSPRLVELFQQVRIRLLPDVVKKLYVTAKASFQEKRFEAARVQFTDLLTLITTADPATSSSDFADLRQLGEGFLKLTDAELSTNDDLKPAASGTPVSNVPDEPEKIYSVADADVTPPIDVNRALPRWNPPPDAARQGTFRGILAVVIDQNGRVENASLDHPISRFYDTTLLAAAKKWRFQPATRNGKPVKFQKQIEIILAPE